MEELDEDIDTALTNAAMSLWSFASKVGESVSETVGKVNEGNGGGVVERIGKGLGGLEKRIEMGLGIVEKSEESGENKQNEEEEEEKEKSRDGDSGGGVGLDLNVLGERLGKGMGELKEQVGDSAGRNFSELKKIMGRAADGVGHMDLNQLGETIGKGVGELKENFVHTIESALGEDEDGDAGGKRGSVMVPDVPLTRFQERVDNLRASLESYTEGVEDEGYTVWKDKEFSIDNVEKECIEILGKYDAVADFYERTVPDVVPEEEFWGRYFWRKRELELEEKKRRKLLEGAHMEQEEDTGGWEDDWDDDGDNGNSEDLSAEQSNKAKPNGNGGVSADLPDADGALTEKREESEQNNADRAKLESTEEVENTKHVENTESKAQSASNEYTQEGNNTTASMVDAGGLENKASAVKPKKQEEGTVAVENGDDDDDWE